MSKPHHFEAVGWIRFYALARRLAHRIRVSGYRPDIIVGIGRGGYMPARILSDFLGVHDLTSFKIEHYAGIDRSGEAFVRYPLNAELDGRRVLLVDDVNDSGETLAVAVAHLRSRGAPRELRTAVLDHKAGSGFRPDYFVRRIVNWRWIIYPWALAEDVGALVRDLRPPTRAPAEVAQRLAVEHRVRVPRAVLIDVLAMIEADG